MRQLGKYGKNVPLKLKANNDIPQVFVFHKSLSL